MEEKGLFARLFGFGGAKRKNLRVETQYQIKSVADIPPLIEAKKLIGDNKAKEAIIKLFNAAKADYCKYYSVKEDRNEPNRQFLLRSFLQFGIKIPEEGNLDNIVIQDYINDPPVINDNMINQFSALRKLTNFYLEFYESAKFSDGFKGDTELIIEKISDIYNYMDIPTLYFSGERN
ncbi:MAG: hypothetical protein M1148_02000 [Candidatus Thermoplasmatota archaeon]|nr:hypothetical protein [Candidatus Thermoplasmatota archaeon]